jgi:hypoxanthine phosphoribosyltransferase
MPEFIPVLEKDQIERIVSALARRISEDYKGRELVLIGVLKGAFIFLSDLVRHMTIPVSVDFVRAASYGSGTSSSGTLNLTKEIETDITGKDVLVVEDIVDTGLTLSRLMEYLKTFEPRSVEVCTFIDKYERRKIAVEAKYAGHQTGQGFLVGYGLDYDEAYRELPGIYHLKFKPKEGVP